MQPRFALDQPVSFGRYVIATVTLLIIAPSWLLLAFATFLTWLLWRALDAVTDGLGCSMVNATEARPGMMFAIALGLNLCAWLALIWLTVSHFRQL